MDNSRFAAKLAELKAKSQGGLIWKPKPGKQTVRIVPYLFDLEYPFIELYFHYEVSSKPLISPITFGRPDPINEFAQKLKGGTKEDYKLGAKIEPKQRVYVPILIRGEEDRGVKFWGFGTTIYKELLTKMDNPKWGDITSLTEGRDIEVTFEKPTKPGAYPKTEIDVDPERTPLTHDKSVLEKLREMPNLAEMYAEPTYHELETLLNKYIESGGQPVQADPRYSNTPDDEDETSRAVPPQPTPQQPREIAENKPPVQIPPSTAQPQAATVDNDMLAAYQSYFTKK